jgi:hypothetical protein
MEQTRLLVEEQKGHESALAESYVRIRMQTEALCRPLETEDYVIQSMPDVSPAKWHLGHTTWFFETFLLQKFFSRNSYRDSSSIMKNTAICSIHTMKRSVNAGPAPIVVCFPGRPLRKFTSIERM